ncbi:MAG: ACP S-malonyltransferase [Desulfobacterales bacterium]|nr:ACP S-malonyltransferase [Desulfobacterales bacterium]
MGNERKKIAVMFPGQGSQYVGMVKEFLDSDPRAGELMDMAEAVSGFPLRSLCLEGPLSELTRSVHLQPAITAANLICWQALARAGVRADYFVGHSLGEYSALCAAGILTPEDTMELVTVRGRLMEREGRKHPGGMRAVLGLTMAEVTGALAGLAGRGIVTAANHNSEKQVVISGDPAGLDAAAALFAEQGAKVIPLQVSVANHSPLVADAVPDFRAAMARINFARPTVPVLFNVTAAEETDPAAIRDIVARQIASPVRWFDSINSLVTRQVRIFIEVGPKTVLSGLLRKIAPRDYNYQRLQVDSPAGLAACLEKLG